MSGWRLGMGRNGRRTLNGVPLDTRASQPARGREPVATVLPFPLPDNVVPIGQGHVLKARRQHARTSHDHGTAA